MKKINLKSDELTVRREAKGSGNTSLAVGVIVLLITLGTYGVLMMMNQRTATQYDAMETEIGRIKTEMDSSEFHELYDFQARLYEIEELIKDKNSQNANLEKIAAYTLPATNFVSVEQKSTGQQTAVVATIIVPDHYLLSQQLEAYSVMDGAKEVSLIDSAQEDEGVEAQINFSINKN